METIFAAFIILMAVLFVSIVFCSFDSVDFFDWILGLLLSKEEKEVDEVIDKIADNVDFLLKENKQLKIRNAELEGLSRSSKNANSIPELVPVSIAEPAIEFDTVQRLSERFRKEGLEMER